MFLFLFTSPLFAPVADRLDGPFREREAAYRTLERAGPLAWHALGGPPRSAEHEMRCRALARRVERAYAWHLSQTYAPFPPFWGELAPWSLDEALAARLQAWDPDVWQKHPEGGPAWARYRLRTRLWVADQVAAGRQAEDIRADLARIEEANREWDRYFSRRP